MFLNANGIGTLRDILQYFLKDILKLWQSKDEKSCESLSLGFDAIDSCGMILETIIEDGI